MKRRNLKQQPTSQPLAEKITWQEACENIYRFCYWAGVQTVRCWHSVVRFTRIFWRPLAHVLYRFFDWLFLRLWRRIVKECRSLRADFSRAGEKVNRRKAGYWRRLLSLPGIAVRRHKGAFRTVLNVGAPLLALVLLVQTLMYWHTAPFALAWEYNGEQVGYIAGEQVYADAAAMVSGLVIDEENTFQVERSPKLTVAVADSQLLMDTEAVRDVLLEHASGSLSQTTGLYVNGEFYGAIAANTLDSLMQTVLKENEDPKADHVDFFAQIEKKNGLFPVTAVKTSEEMLDFLRMLPIQSVRYETKTETLAYGTVVKETTAQPLGYQKIETKGKNGRHRVTEEIITVNGREQYRSVVSTEVLKKPVDQVVIVGARKYTEDVEVGDGKATGTFVWPVPYTKVISSPFASRWGAFHGAIDIANGSTDGKPIIASDGGVVVEAEYHSSYGYNVLIDHGNGFKTRYAHCSKLMVEEGQKVAQGEYIANVGNTGYSFGAHLHFEVIKNGQLVDPLDYVKR